MSSQDQPQPQLPLVPGNFATVRANAIGVLHLNGAFVVAVFEDRIVKLEDGRAQAANFEIGRYFANVPTVLQLAKNLGDALKAYHSLFGQVPAQLLAPGTPNVDQAIKALEDMLKGGALPPEEPPE